MAQPAILPAIDPAMTQPAAAQSTADLTMDQAASIDNDIDHITAQLAAFCFEQLERSVTTHDALDLNTDASALENEFQVMYYIAMETNQYIQRVSIQIISAISENAE
jgi:hypothetical protein